MKSQNIVLLAFLLCLSAIKCQDTDKTVFFTLSDASNSTTFGSDGESSFFDYPSGLNLEIPLVISPNKTFDLFEKITPFLSNFSIDVKSAEDIKIQAIKTYWRNAGYLPYDLIEEEMELANKDRWHTPDMNHTQLSVLYFVYKIPIQGRAYQIKHQVTELCMKVKNDFRHFIIDRGYYAVYPNVWNSKIRVIYTGASKNCDFEDKAWADKRAGTWNNSGVSTPQIHHVAQGRVQRYALDDLIDDAYFYFQNFPIYNTLYNCQHFGTNLFNKLTEQKVSFVSDDIMVRPTETASSNILNLLFKFLKNIVGKKEQTSIMDKVKDLNKEKNNKL